MKNVVASSCGKSRRNTLCVYQRALDEVGQSVFAHVAEGTGAVVGVPDSSVYDGVDVFSVAAGE
eukprot:CAMPEP_0184384772 /NCGR_PEP_ID=MMETSP0007-20130409/8164_1 /TAXON_ID=97485 /ORGANISM="Prymnesium parvum, Strain Texoma1" /LENGTH=63 /DNA_ID=CAMNT_0026731751 /DNA_START=129 /DNA_END=320 /DNA_ORIENTATION=-